ncbi:hypothetical protein EJB05_02839, partial [Eragrostis curvula]
MAPDLPDPEATAPPGLTDHLLEEVFIRIGTHADLIRASVACTGFLRLITDPAFLRRYRTLHPPLLLGFVGCGEAANVYYIPAGPATRFLPAEAPHPNEPAARALAAAADFSFDHHPDQGLSSWPRCDARNGRVLLMSSDSLHGGLAVSPVLSVCDPLTRAYTLLPPIPDNLRASVLDEVQGDQFNFFDAIFDPSGGNEEALFGEETQFRVVCWAISFSMTVVFVYSSVSGSWSHGTSIVFDALDLDIPPECYPIMGRLHSYAYGCLYWDVDMGNHMIKLDINSMEFTTVSLPSDHATRSTMFVEAGEGRIGMFSLIIPEAENPQSLSYSIWQNEGENAASEHSVETTIQLSSDYKIYLFDGAAEGYIFLTGLRGGLTPGSAFFSVEIKTLKFERVCRANIGRDPEYGHFRPFISPRRI